MHVRLAQLKDADRITHVHVQAWQESYTEILDAEFLNQISYEDRLQLRHSILSSKTSRCYVAETEEEVIGFCDVGVGSDGSGELYALYILDRYKRTGVGKALWKKALTYFKSHELMPFHTWVLRNNQAARRFYEKHGGQMTKELPVKIGEKIYDEVRYTFMEVE